MVKVDVFDLTWQRAKQAYAKECIINRLPAQIPKITLTIVGVGGIAATDDGEKNDDNEYRRGDEVEGRCNLHSCFG